MNKCIICLNTSTLTDEHIIPEFVGGSLIVKNVCQPCNSRMGSSFEGRLSRNLLFSIPAHIHGIKTKSGLSPFPFAGNYTIAGNTKIKVLKDGRLKTLPSAIDVKKIDSGYQFTTIIDPSDIGSLEASIKRKIKRLFNDESKPLTPEKLSSLTQQAMDSSEKVHSSQVSPMLNGTFSIDFNDLDLLFLKIAYEFGVYLFGEPYLHDTVAEKIRNNLHLCEMKHKINTSLQQKIPLIDQLLSDEHHWIVVVKNVMYIKIFNITCSIIYASETFFNTVQRYYRFCYKNCEYKEVTIYELM